ncbi:MAG: AMP-binding protein [Rhodoferax sp.]|jgi:long-chain acyl-CoA synthetase|nr:AMP-binding protein [Rhodoferax sp.]MBK7547718.1 AMP-binding protein [Rhodoferax sp.]
MNNPIPLRDSDLPLQRFYQWERERADKIFLTQPVGNGMVRDITWGQAGDEVRRMAAWLKSQGWPAGSKIAILGKNSAHWILTDLAIWMAGYVSVPIYPTFNGDALRFILTHSESRACFVGKLDEVSSLKTGVPAGVPLISLPLAPALDTLSWDAAIAATAPLQGAPVRDGEELSTIIYTSGTTGNPKGVMHKFSALAWALSSAAERVHMNSDDRYLSYLPLAHVAERMVIEQGALRNGSRIFFAESLDTFVQDLNRARPTVFFSVPRLWVKFQQGVHAKMPPAKLKRLMRLPIIGGLVRRKILKGLGLDQCRIAAGGAAPMPPDVLNWYRDLGLDLIEVYGMTENCGVSHATLPGTCRPGTVGLPYKGVESRIDPNTGEIQMRCPALMMGYYKDPEQTAATMSDDGWLKTGDKGHVEKDGSLRITGRVKDLFKTSKGKYVAPAPIEDLLVTHPDIEACAVTGANFAQPLGIVMLSLDAAARVRSPEQRSALTASLTEHLYSVNARLEAHEQLDCLAVIATAWTPENGLVTPTFKVKRPRIEDTYALHYEAWLAQRQPVIWATS